MPTEHVTRRVAPGSAPISLVTGQKIQKQTRVIQPPGAVFAQLENTSEELFARIPLDKYILLGSMLIIKTRRNGHTLHSERHHIIQKSCNILCGFPLE